MIIINFMYIISWWYYNTSILVNITGFRRNEVFFVVCIDTIIALERFFLFINLNCQSCLQK